MKSISQNKNLHSRIDLNQYKGKLLLLSAEVDNYWPSKQMRNEIARHAKIDVTHKVLNLSGYPFFEYDKSIKEITSLLKETR
jgi:hypothetical protein